MTKVNKENENTQKKIDETWNEVAETASRINNIQNKIHETILSGIKSKEISNKILHERESFITEYNKLINGIENSKKKKSENNKEE